LRFYAHVARICQSLPEAWDRPLVNLLKVTPNLWFEMNEWVKIVLKNESVPVVTKEGSPDLILIVDASAWGWGAVSIDTRTGSVEYASAPWPHCDLQRYQSSVFAEPRGVWAAMNRFIVRGKHRAVHVLTDHQPIVFAAKSGRPKCQFYNDLLENARTVYPSVYVTYEHIEGTSMPSDGMSRGEEIDEESIEKAKILAKEKFEKMNQPRQYGKGHPWMT
jgi:hypothetical protein